MTGDIQIVHFLLWESASPDGSGPQEFVWASQDRLIADARKQLRPCSDGLIVYAGTMPVPVDGDFADDKSTMRSLELLFENWPRGACPPLDQVLQGAVEVLRP